MIEIAVLKSFDSGTYKAGVQLVGSLTTYFDDISVAKNIPSSALVTGPMSPEFAEILTPNALEFVARLQRRFNHRRRELLARRQQVQDQLDAGHLPDFLPQTRGIRESNWRVVDVPEQLRDRRVES